MSATTREVSVCCLDEQARLCGILRLVQSDRKADSIRILSTQEAKQYGEEKIQLQEGCSYDFELQEVHGKLRVQANGVVKPSSLRPEIGRIETGVETGLLQVVLEDEKTGLPIARGSVEVLPTKINYRQDYRGMLTFIADECSELLFNVWANTRMRLAPKYKTEPQNLQRQLEFLCAELNSSRFLAAIQRIMTTPHQKLETHWEERNISRPCKTGRNFARQVSSTTMRVRLPAEHSISRSMAAQGISDLSLPATVLFRKQSDSLDTPENRFVKYVLAHFRDVLKRIYILLKQHRTEDRQRLFRNINHLQELLNELLSRDFFKGISEIHVLPLGSPVLQRKSGYREIFLTWLKLDIEAQLSWKGGDDVYGAGKRDMATLYEYWLFFQLYRLFRDKFELTAQPARSLFEQTHGGLNLRLKVNEPLGIKGICVREARRLNVRFHYNLT
ncbi:MAG: DUF2357 domain-containing protein, partial [Nitrospirae bacterium]|nr:DUF2357 domain-containing protein [Nitrospirota bacterium]